MASAFLPPAQALLQPLQATWQLVLREQRPQLLEAGFLQPWEASRKA